MSEQENKLQQFGKYFGTDKYDLNHSYAGKSYLDVYDKYLSDLRKKDINFLEIGVKDGESHRMWSHYFTKNSKIYGIDIDPRCKASEKQNIKIFIGSQIDKEVIDSVVKDANDKFDVILDDGSHVNELTIKSFELLFSHLKPGGLYIIEDLGCSYMEESLGDEIVKGSWPGMQYNKNVSFVNNRKDMDDFFFKIIKDIDLSNNNLYEWVHFYSKIAIIKKQG
jgi:cephalosporin hydroxylase